jgi:hypothetical protein
VKSFGINEPQIYRLIGDNFIINQKRSQTPESIYILFGDDSTIDQKIFQTPNSEHPQQNPDFKFFDAV